MVFDLGGVVIDYNPRDYLADRFFHEAIENKIYDAMFGSEEWHKLDKGEMTYLEAASIFLERGRDGDFSFEMQAVVDNWTEMLTTKKATINLIKLFKKYGMNVYYLSNMARETMAYLQQRNFFQLFDGGLASCDLGLCKPDPAIYRAGLEKYSLKPQETLFADDYAENAKAAFEAGITGIQFKNVKSFCKMLVTYGIEI